VREAEDRNPDDLDRMGAALAGLRVRLYDSSHTIESAAADLAAWAASQGRRASLFIDSIQAARSSEALTADTPRLIVEANVAAMRVASTSHRMLTIATSEANRASYRDQSGATETNDLAAGAESRAIEFGAQTQLVLRTPKGCPDIIHVRVAKNRRARVGEFWLRLDRERHAVTEVGDPGADPKVVAEREEGARDARRAGMDRDAQTLMSIVRARPGMGSRDLRAAIVSAGHKWGRDRLDALIAHATAGVHGSRLRDDGVDRGSRHDPAYFVEAISDAHGGSNE
jgi:hypothetical protein